LSRRVLGSFRNTISQLAYLDLLRPVILLAAKLWVSFKSHPAALILRRLLFLKLRTRLLQKTAFAWSRSPINFHFLKKRESLLKTPINHA
jgi:hypothetical protein